jgi:hypothetical protein
MHGGEGRVGTTEQNSIEPHESGILALMALAVTCAAVLMGMTLADFQEYQLHYTTVRVDPAAGAVEVVAADGHIVYSTHGPAVRVGTGGPPKGRWAETIKNGALYEELSIKATSEGWTIDAASAVNPQGAAGSVWGEPSAVTVAGTVDYPGKAGARVAYNLTLNSSPLQRNLAFGAEVFFTAKLPRLDFMSFVAASDPTDEVVRDGAPAL